MTRETTGLCSSGKDRRKGKLRESTTRRIIYPPIINAIVNYDEGTSEFLYEYSATNTGGKQPLYTIIIVFGDKISDVTKPSEEWYSDWYGINRRDAWEWAATRSEIHGILYGETVEGFSFKSKGLPSITNSIFYGYRRAEIGFPGDYDTEEVDEAFDIVWEKIEKQYPDKFKDVVLRTLGPTAPPEVLKPVEFIANLIKMKEEAYTLGWITDKGIEISLDQKLENIKKKLQQGNTGAAKNILNAFINEVEAQGCESYETECPKGKHLKPEAYALLKYNVKYLAENMK